MENRFGFTLLTVEEFGAWLKEEKVSRVITAIQIHHTWLPDYSNFNGKNHFEKLQGMKSSHIERGFSDIAQNITVFPDGKLAICRTLNTIPAGIYGQNSRGICIENLGNFDTGKDQMTASHREAIVGVVAHLCHRFGLKVSTESIIYHHWFDLSTGQRTNGSGNTKSCPGTAFFGGNTLSDAEQNFLPLVAAAIRGVNTPPAPEPVSFAAGIVTSSAALNIRSGPGTGFLKTGELQPGATVNILEENQGWYKVSTKSDWVSARYISRVKTGTVIAASAPVYKGPAVTNNYLSFLNRGDSIVIHATLGGWYRIDFTDKWVIAENIALDE
jgi:uncharacterized protein YraI